MIIKNAEQKIISMVDEHEITKRANEQANEIIAKAQKNARDIRIGTLEYSDNLLSQLDNTLKAMGESVNKSRSDLYRNAELGGAYQDDKNECGSPKPFAIFIRRKQ